MTSKDTAPKRAVIYCRISKDRTGAGLGVGKQEADCRALAAGLGIDVIGVRTDNDLTAFKGSQRSKPRPGYDALLDDIRSRQADAVLAWHTDRVFRDMTELEGYISACGTDGGIPTYTVRSSNLDLTTASGRMVARILGAVQQQEVEHMIERQKSAKERIRAAGGWQGGPRAFGFRRDGASVKNGGDGRIVHVPEEAAAIRKGCELVLAQGGGLREIGRQWSRAGLRTPREAARGGNRPWDATAVRVVLLRASNAGLIEYDGQIVSKGNWEPIVDESTWRAVRAILTDPARRAGPGPKPKYLLTGVLICGVCGGRTFTVTSRQSARQRLQYECISLVHHPAAARPEGMKMRHLTRVAGPLDKHIEDIIIERLSRPDVVAALNAGPEVDIVGLDARRTEINAELDEWARTPGITPRQLQIHNEPLLAELADVERQISEALRGDPLPEFAGRDAAEVWAGLGIDRKRTVAAMLLRVRLLPLGRVGRVPFNYDAVEILPPDA